MVKACFQTLSSRVRVRRSQTAWHCVDFIFLERDSAIPKRAWMALAALSVRSCGGSSSVQLECSGKLADHGNDVRQFVLYHSCLSLLCILSVVTDEFGFLSHFDLRSSSSSQGIVQTSLASALASFVGWQMRLPDLFLFLFVAHYHPKISECVPVCRNSNVSSLSFCSHVISQLGSMWHSH